MKAAKEGGVISKGSAYLTRQKMRGVLYVPPKRPYTLARAAVNGFGARWRGRLGLSLPVPFVRKISQAGHIPIMPFLRTYRWAILANKDEERRRCR
jgi:hypothetical protein